MTSVALAAIGAVALLFAFVILRNLDRFTDHAKQIPMAPTAFYSHNGFGCGAISIGLLGIVFLVASLVFIGR